MIAMWRFREIAEPGKKKNKTVKKFVKIIENRLLNVRHSVQELHKEVFRKIQISGEVTTFTHRLRTMEQFSDLLDADLLRGATRMFDNYQTLDEQKYSQSLRQRNMIEEMVRKRAKFLAGAFEKFKDIGKHIYCQDKFQIGHVLKTLAKLKKESLIMAYKGLKERAEYLNGKTNGRSGVLREKLIRRLMDQGFNLQCMAWNQFITFYRSENLKIAQQRTDILNIETRKKEIIRRFTSKSYQQITSTFKQFQSWSSNCEIRETNLKIRETNFILKQQSYLKRMIDSNLRLVASGYNRLREYVAEERVKVSGHLK
jgi:hypothetical protein